MSHPAPSLPATPEPPAGCGCVRQALRQRSAKAAVAALERCGVSAEVVAWGVIAALTFAAGLWALLGGSPA